MGQNFSFGRHKEPSSPSSSEAVGTPDHRVLAVDPRSPTVEISRTPIEVDTSPKRQETDLTTPARNPRDLRRNVIERNMLKNAQAS